MIIQFILQIWWDLKIINIYIYIYIYLVIVYLKHIQFITFNCVDMEETLIYNIIYNIWNL